MLPESVLVLARPPGYNDARLKTFATSVGLQVKLLKTQGQPLSECMQSVKDKECEKAVRAYKYVIFPSALDKCLMPLTKYSVSNKHTLSKDCLSKTL